MQTGLERFLQDPALRAPLAGRRVALLAHPASVTHELTHALDAIAALPDVRLSAAFGPQHGLRGDKPENIFCFLCSSSRIGLNLLDFLLLALFC